MNAKKNLIALMSISALLLSSCGSAAEEVEVTTTLPVKVVEETLQTTKSPESEAETEETPEEEQTELDITDEFLKNIEINMSDTIDLSLVNINNTWVSVSNSLDSFISSADIAKCSWSSISSTDDELYFLGNGYGIMSNPEDPTSFNGTLIGIECYTSYDGKLAAIINDDSMDVYNIKAVVSTRENTKEDFEVSYYNGIKVGMSHEEIKKAFGEELSKETVTETSTETVTEVETSAPAEESEAPVSESAEGTSKAEVKEKAETQSEEKTVTETVAKAEAPATESKTEETVTVTSAPESSPESADEETTETTVETVTTTVPESTAPPETTAAVETTATPEAVQIPSVLFYKNTNNTIVIEFKDGIVDKIFLYNNITKVVQ